MYLQEILKAVVLIKPAQRKDPAEARPQRMNAAAPFPIQEATAFIFPGGLHVRQNNPLHQVQLQLVLQKRLKAHLQSRSQPPYIVGIQNNCASHALKVMDAKI